MGKHRDKMEQDLALRGLSAKTREGYLRYARAFVAHHGRSADELGTEDVRTCLEQHRWLERRRERILPTPYFHVVFTLPAELRSIVLAHRERLYTMLMRAASETLLTLARDDERLGAIPAITMVLHTWTRELLFHPHVHAIVSAGGLRMGEQPRWVPGNDRYLFPVRSWRSSFVACFETYYWTRSMLAR